ncbi:MAG: hypothetical protein AABX65_00100, partial [Nanoarchaeota archaeon]
IHETTGEDAVKGIDEAEKIIENLVSSGIPVAKARKLLEEAKQNLANRKFQVALELTEQIKNIKENAFLANGLIYEIKSKIYGAEDKGLQVEETRRLMNLAQAAFEREDFIAAIRRAKDAELSIVLETKGKINIVKFIIDYWWPLLVALIILSTFGYLIKKKLALILISRRLEDLKREEATITDLMRETQEKYYNLKRINTPEYHKAMYNYEKRLSEVSQLIPKLRSKRVGIIKISNEIRNLREENQNVVNLIKQLQDNYYAKQSIPRKIYLTKMGEYKTRITEIETSIAVLEAKLAKKEKLEEIAAKEASKRKIFEDIKKRDKKYIAEILDRKENKSGIRRHFAFISRVPKMNFSKVRINFSKAFSKDKYAAPKKESHSEMLELLDDLIKKKEKPKQLPF